MRGRSFLPLLARNPVSLVGIAVATTAAVLFLVFLLLELLGLLANPHLGLLVFVAIPAVFVLGLLLIPIRVTWSARRTRRTGTAPEWPVIDFRTPAHRSVVLAVLALTAVNIVLISIAAYGGLHYMETAEFWVTSWNVGLNVHPGAVVAFGANYGRDAYGSFQRSRNANPPPDPSFTDPTRDWTLDNDDKVNTASVYLDLLRAVRNTDIRFGYDYSDSDNSFVHGGPRVAALASINQFIPLPAVENTWHRATADVQYFFASRVGIGVGYYFEKLDIVDFNTIDTTGPTGFAPATGEPRIDWLGALTTGYGNRPYTGHTAYVRVLYRF